MEDRNISDIESSKSLIVMLNEAFKKSSNHIYLNSIQQKLTDEVIQELGRKYSEFNGSTKESIIKALLKEFDMALAESPPIAFLIQLVEEIDKQIVKVQQQNNKNIEVINQEITKVQQQNNNNLNEIATINNRISEINNILKKNTETLDQISQRFENVGTLVSGFQAQLQGIDNRVTERVKGGLSEQLSTIEGLEVKVDNLDRKIPVHLISKKDFWGGIITIGGLIVSAFGVLAFVWLMLNSSIDRIERSTSDKIDMSNKNHKIIIDQKTDILSNDLNNSQRMIDQRLKRIEDKLLD